MGWAKFDDQFSDHPKVQAAGPMAELLAMRAVIYCARYETDGKVRESILPRLTVGISSPKKQVAALVREGLWEESDDGWVVHDFLDYHPSKAEKEAEREAARERMRNVRANKKRTKPEPQSNGKRSSDYPDPTPSPPRSPTTSTDQTTNAVLDVDMQAEILEHSNAFRMLRKRRRWPDYAAVLEEWSELGAKPLASAVDVFASLVSDGYADTPNLLRTACEKVSMHGSPKQEDVPDWLEDHWKQGGPDG